MLTNQDKKDIGEIVQTAINKAIGDLIDNVLVPTFNLLVTKTELKRVEDRLDKVIDNQLEDQGKLRDHQKHIDKLESSIISS